MGETPSLDDTRGVTTVARKTRRLGVIGALALAGSALAQQPDLIRVDERITDRDLLATSLRVLETDIRQDLNFEHLYVNANNPSQYVRVSGGLYAVAPRTDYYTTRRGGVYAAVAPGTVFYIGMPWIDPATPSRPDTSLGRMASGPTLAQPIRNDLVHARSHEPRALRRFAGVEESTQRERVEMGRPRGRPDMSNEGYRSARLREIARSIASAD